MAEMLDESSSVESSTVGVFRTSATVKGGRRFSFGALVVVGDKRGRVGFGYGKSNEVPQAVDKAQKYAKRAMVEIPMAGRTLPHEVQGKFGASSVRLIPASPGTGVVAGSTIRAILEMAGITDCLTKCYGNTNKFNLVKACFDGIVQLRRREQIAAARGVTLAVTDIEHKIEKGKAFASTAKGEKMKGPVNTIGQDRRGGRGGGGGGRGGRGGRGGGGMGGGGGGGGAGRDAGAPQGGAPTAGDAAPSA
ncbi:MAG: 30S ribosomal protein S5 [Phycisphaerales bacterium]|nr:30S ribosomal protein S5 [Phycisphaerales bacterium]